MQAYLVPCWWVGRWLWRAGCISQDTYLLYLLNLKVKTLKRNCIIGILGHPLLAVLELRDCFLSHMGKCADWDTQILILGCIYICSTLYVLYCDQAVAPMFTYSVQLTFSTIYF